MRRRPAVRNLDLGDEPSLDWMDNRLTNGFNVLHVPNPIELSSRLFPSPLGGSTTLWSPLRA